MVISDDEKLKLIVILREETGCGVTTCKRALSDLDWEIAKARIYVRILRRCSKVLIDPPPNMNLIVEWLKTHNDIQVNDFGRIIEHE